jgi:hypothetical protein
VLDIPLTPEEKALVDKGATMEMYEPMKHSGHEIVQIRVFDSRKSHLPPANQAADSVVAFIFGIEDCAPAREEGISMAAFSYSPQMAQQFLFAQGWDKYHDRYFTRAYVQEGMNAFEKARQSTRGK